MLLNIVFCLGVVIFLQHGGWRGLVDGRAKEMSSLFSKKASALL